MVEHANRYLFVSACTYYLYSMVKPPKTAIINYYLNSKVVASRSQMKNAW